MSDSDTGRGTFRSRLVHGYGYVRRRLARLARPFASGLRAEAPAWTVSHSAADETRWTHRDETVACFRFDDGYVATVTYDGREVTWQLLPGPSPLGTALAAVALYLEHGVPPQVDSNARAFFAVDGGDPTHVYEEAPDRPVEYVYLGGYRAPDEYPDAVPDRDDVRNAFERMSASKPHPLD